MFSHMIRVNELSFCKRLFDKHETISFTRVNVEALCMDKLGVFHANQNLCVLIHICTKGEVLLTFSRRYFFCGSFVLLMSCDCHAFVSLAALWSPAGKGLTSWLLFVMLLWFVTFPCGILGQVWYWIVSNPDLCCLSYFYYPNFHT